MFNKKITTSIIGLCSLFIIVLMSSFPIPKIEKLTLENKSAFLDRFGQHIAYMENQQKE